MTPTIAILLIITFVLSTVGLLLLIWSIANNQFSHGQEAARSIFSPGEEGHSEDPARPADPSFTGENTAQAAAIKARWIADQSSRTAVLTWLSSSIFWLVLGSFFGLVSSIKMHLPEFLAASEFLTFGRIRPAHLNAVTYGWASMAGIGVALFLIPRLFKTSLAGGKYAVFGAVIWNIGLILGLTAIIIGLSDGGAGVVSDSVSDRQLAFYFSRRIRRHG